MRGMARKSMLRWGILSTALIARKNWKAIRLSGNGVVTAVASRDLARCRKFIAECQAESSFAVEPRAVGDYAELVTAKDVDAVYIPLPTGVRKEWVIRAAEAGKHVICEKPCAKNLRDLKEMIAVCEANGVQFMDGVMFEHSKRPALMRKVLDDGKTVGKIRRINTHFSISAGEEFLANNIRMRDDLEPHGALGDLGWYCVRLPLWTMKWKLPRRVSGRLLDVYKHPKGKAAVPATFSGEMFFDGGVTVGFYCSFLTGFEQHATISGTHGYLRLEDFVVPLYASETAFETGKLDFGFIGCDCNIERSVKRWTVKEYGSSHPTTQETNLFRNFAAQVQSGKLNKVWPELAWKTQLVLEACFASAKAGGKMVAVG